MDGRTKRHIEKTHSVIRWLLIGLGLIMITIAGWAVAYKIMDAKLFVSAGDGVYRVSVARTESQQQKGLAGVKSLAADEGMLFAFSKNDYWPIWMKGMRIPIDIIWINEKKRVVHIERNVQPDAAPYVTYLPDEPAKYVLELPAGTAARDRISKNTLVLFEMNEESK